MMGHEYAYVSEQFALPTCRVSFVNKNRNILMINQSDGEMLPPYTTVDYPDNTQKLLTQLANHFCMLGIHPEQIIVSDMLTFALISDFCNKCNIKLKKVDSMPELDYACDCMIQYMMEL